jgi:tyrosine recombinase XerC
MSKPVPPEVTAFLRHLATLDQVSENTLKAYESDLAQFFAIVGKTQEVTTQDIRRYLVILSHEGRTPRTIARKLAAVRTFYRYLEREGIVADNPARRVLSPRFRRGLPRALTVEEMHQFIEAAMQDDGPLGVRNWALMEVLYGGGLRSQEAVDLDVRDVNRQTGMISVTGKGGKPRIVPIGRKALEALEAYLSVGRPKLVVGKEPALFVNARGRRLTTRSVRRIVKATLVKSALHRNISPHWLRHSYATHMLMGGADLRVVQELLGHESLSTTQLYTYVSQEQLSRIYQNTHPRA